MFLSISISSDIMESGSVELEQPSLRGLQPFTIKDSFGPVSY